MTFRHELATVMRLDLAEALRSRWLLFCVGAYGLVAAFFVLVGLRESNILGFTGLGRVLFSLCHALALLLPLLALTATTQLVNRARDDGTLELLFSLPIRRSAWFTGVSATRLLVLTVPLVVLVTLLALVARLAGQAVPWAFVGRTLVVSTCLVTAFTGLGLLVSTLVRHSARALLCALVAWAMGVAVLDFGLIGLMLRWRLQPLTVLVLGALNPVQSARLALVSGADPELGILGPVGTFLWQRVGESGLFVLGTAWPLAFGLGAWALAARAFSRGDLV